jgi:hypothetical protein
MFRLIRAFVCTLALTACLTTAVSAEQTLIASEIRKAIEIDFPLLKGRFSIEGPATPQYNCIAWSLGITAKWIWPGAAIEDFDGLNRKHRYRRLARMNFDVRPGQEKIVLYGKIDKGVLVATHQARQMPDGTWTSKLGKMPLIRHQSPHDLNGTIYGRPVAVYMRPVR